MNALSPQITTALLVLGTVQISRNLDLENPDTINYVRLGYGISQVIIIAILFYIKTRIEATPNKTIIEVNTAQPSFTDPNPTGPTKRMTIQEYDLSEWNSQLKQVVFPMALIIGLHFYIGFVQPLIIQSLLPLKALYSTPLFQVYVLGQKAEGKLARPWKKPSPLDGLLPSAPQPENQQQEIENTNEDETTTEETTDNTETTPAPSEPKPKTRKRNVPRDS